MANYAIGDIQGCYKPFKSLLKQINFDPHSDKLWLAGDLVNRGPKSLKTLRYIMELGDACETVLGNHDLHMLAVYHEATEARPKDNFMDVLESPDVIRYVKWLKKQSLMKEINIGEKTFLLSHAGIPPIWSKKQALSLAAEVESCLKSNNADAFFRKMYGNKPDCWNEGLSGYKRLRVITNYFTRMRFCDEDGRLELNTKTGPDNAPAGFQPWFEIPNPSLKKDTVLLFGHWAATMGITGDKRFIALDTGCVWGNCLTAYRLEDGKTFSCEC